MWRWLRHPGIVAGLLLLFGGSYWALRPRTTKPIGLDYVGERDATLWNTIAQVRQPVADLHYGERLELLHEEGAAAQVRTTSGITGWLLDSREMMDASLWQRSADLLNHAHTLPVQALGHTNAISNVHIDAGRDAQRIFQFSRGTPVAVLGRMVVADTGSGESGSENPPGQETSANDEHKSKAEDWLLVMRAPGAVTASAGPAAESTPPQPPFNAPSSTASSVGSGPEPQSASTSNATEMPIAGWVLERFIDPDLPDTVKDHASAADMRPVAWFVLDRVPDGSGGQASQYLVAGTRGGEGQECDFNMLQVYTWGAVRMRYETAYVESNLCGKLPIYVSNSSRGPEFRFQNVGDEQGEFNYLMQDTIVRRVREASPANSSKRAASGILRHRTRS